ncbi:MAG: hypothetical protein ACREN4_08990, partial [Candidatus Dormibacteria bacterium]
MTGRVLFLGPDPIPALGAGLDVVCADSCGITAAPGARLAELWSDGPASSAALLRLGTVRDQLLRSGSTLLVWKSSAELERQADELGVTLANSPARVARRLENKAHFSQAAAGAGLPLVPTVIGRIGKDLWAQAERLAPPWVVQLAQGFSGQHTYPATSRSELALLGERFPDRLARVSSLLDGTPVTITGAVGPRWIVLGKPCLQLTGLEELTPYPLGSCGNDFAAPVPGREEVERLGRRAAEWLGAEGHRGVFGLDLIVDGGGRA